MVKVFNITPIQASTDMGVSYMPSNYAKDHLSIIQSVHLAKYIFIHGLKCAPFSHMPGLLHMDVDLWMWSVFAFMRKVAATHSKSLLQNRIFGS